MSIYENQIFEHGIPPCELTPLILQKYTTVDPIDYREKKSKPIFVIQIFDLL